MKWIDKLEIEVQQIPTEKNSVATDFIPRYLAGQPRLQHRRLYMDSFVAASYVSGVSSPPSGPSWMSSHALKKNVILGSIATNG
jgi:hypothetical protein